MAKSPFAKIGVPQYSTPKPAYPDATKTKRATSAGFGVSPEDEKLKNEYNRRLSQRGNRSTKK